MIIWVDAQISLVIAAWITDQFHCEAIALRDPGLREATDRHIFFAAREADARIISKDFDIIPLVSKHGPPPQDYLASLRQYL